MLMHRVIISNWIVPRGFIGITIYPFIFLRSNSYKNAKVINHERIHLAQQKELLIIGFYLWYLIDYLIKLVKYKNRKQAYRNIIFEKEAYANESDLTYLKQRRMFSFINYKNRGGKKRPQL